MPDDNQPVKQGGATEAVDGLFLSPTTARPGWTTCAAPYPT